MGIRVLKLLVAQVIMAALLVASPTSPASADTGPVQVVAGAFHSCALDPSGQTYCWGDGSMGQLGDNTWSSQLTPLAVEQGLLSFTFITAGHAHTCGLTSAKAVYCWGNNWAGQLGTGDTGQRGAPALVQMPGGVVFDSIVAGAYLTCGLTSAGAAYCWGDNYEGQLGDGSVVDRAVPVAVQQGGLIFASIAPGRTHSCGLTNEGAAYCWGGNWAGQLGDGTNTRRLTPVAVQQGAVDFASLDTGYGHVCGLDDEGQAYCWGDNGGGRLGDNTLSNRNSPVAVQQGSLNFASLTLGTDHGCALISDGTAYCWGRNDRGQLGDNSTNDRFTPVAVTGGTSWSSIASSKESHHNCGVKTGTQLVYCWGYNNYGQLGDQTTVNAVQPVQSWYLVTVGSTSVAVTVLPHLAFGIAGYNAGSCNGATVTSTTSTATAVSLNSNAGSNQIGGQELTVSTNASAGYVLLARTSGPLTSASGGTIADWTGTDLLPTASPAAGTAFFGYNVADLAPFAENKWAGFTNANTSLGSGGVGPIEADVTHICLQVGVSSNTPSGTYSTTLTYTVVPTF